MEEEWKNIKGYEGEYQISSLGRIKSFKNHEEGKILKQYIGNNGYAEITLCIKGKGRNFKVHKLVAETFIKNDKNKDIINHKNGIRSDNRVENLEWCTFTDNNTNVQKLRYENKGRIKRQIEQHDMKGTFMKIWDSISEASKQTKISYANICSCCKGRQESAGGYIWKYKTKLCHNCGLKVEEEDKFCKHCVKEL